MVRVFVKTFEELLRSLNDGCEDLLYVCHFVWMLIGAWCMHAPFFNFGKMISFWRSYEHGFDEEQMRQFMAQLESSRTLKKLGYEKRLLCSRSSPISARF